MAKIVQGAIATRPSSLTEPISLAEPMLMGSGGASSKTRALNASQRLNRSGVDPRRSRSEKQSQKPYFALNAIGLDSLASLNIFMRAAEACSFTDAGRQLGLSSSAVSKCVARLEQRLAVRLFHRNTRCINLTHEGRTLLESCQRIFSELRSVSDELAQTKDMPKGGLRVSMPHTGMLMVPTLGKFIRDYPNIDLDIDFTDSFVDVIDGGYDVVVRSGEVSDSRLKSRSLGTYRFEIVGSPGYFESAGTPRKPEDLLEHACLHWKHPTTSKLHPWPIASSGMVNDLALPTTAMASTLDALVQLAASGVGIACVPSFCASQQIASGSLVRVLEGYVDRTEVVRAIWPSSQYQSPKLKAFIDFLAESVLPSSTATSSVKFDAA